MEVQDKPARARATLLEYGLILALIATVAVWAFRNTGSSINALIQRVMDQSGPGAFERRVAGLPPLYRAVHVCDAGEVKRLLEARVDPHQRQEDGLTPLGCLDWNGGPDTPRGATRREIVKLFLDHGFGPDERLGRVWDETLLCEASGRGDLETVKMLIARGANPRGTGREPRTPIAAANLSGHYEVVKYLLEQKAPAAAVVGPNNSNETLLHEADTAQMVHLLVDHGAALDARSDFGRTPLHIALMSRPPEVAQALLERGADAKARSKHGWTCLHYLGFRHQRPSGAALLPLLLSRGADPAVRTHDGLSPLAIARGRGPGARVNVDLIRAFEAAGFRE